MAFSIRRLGKRFFLTANIIVCLFFLIACLQPWLNPETFWLVSFMSLSFPIGLIGVVGFVLFWGVVKIRYTLISLITLALGFKQINVLFSIKQKTFSESKLPDHLRVMSWNIRSFTGVKKGKESKVENVDSIFNLIKNYDPDIICFQEFGQYDTPGVGENYSKRLWEMGLKHSVLSKDYSRVLYNYTNGLAIFSKYPFVASKRIPFSSNAESLLYADVVLPDADTIRVFTTHLQSFKFTGDDYKDLNTIKNNDDQLVEASKNIFVKMKRAFRNRGSQADMIRPILDASPYPEILGCDMNDVPTSYAYWQLRGNRKDAFLEKGFGIGRTFIALAPTLRIDYLLADNRFTISQFTTIKKRFSDHLPVIMDVKLSEGGN
jgi:endonuclease/exonuclease/phosphatase family metal-dependent hydrolase